MKLKIREHTNENILKIREKTLVYILKIRVMIYSDLYDYVYLGRMVVHTKQKV